MLMRKMIPDICLTMPSHTNPHHNTHLQLRYPVPITKHGLSELELI